MIADQYDEVEKYAAPPEARNDAAANEPASGPQTEVEKDAEAKEVFEHGANLIDP